MVSLCLPVPQLCAQDLDPAAFRSGTPQASTAVATPVSTGAKTTTSAAPAPAAPNPVAEAMARPATPTAEHTFSAAVDSYTAAQLPLPEVGDHELRILNPYLLELKLVTTKEKGKDPQQWNFFDHESRQLNLPETRDFDIRFGDQSIVGVVAEVGYKRRPLYAPHRDWDPRIGNWLYLQLKQPVPEGATVTVAERTGNLWNPAKVTFIATNSADRFSPAIHVNQAGYQTGFAKHARAGYYLGDLGGLELPGNVEFSLIDVATGNEVHKGMTRPADESEIGSAFDVYQDTIVCDFSRFDTPGRYVIRLPQLGQSLPFVITDGYFANVTRSYALGLLHQRCGCEVGLPFTRFEHDACHVAPLKIPTKRDKGAQKLIGFQQDTLDEEVLPVHTAPRLKTTEDSLFPFVKSGTVDVSGGHHDAGDYSRYVPSSSRFIHYLMTAVDYFPGAEQLDNLGLPESSDGVSDLLQMAMWEASYISKMQDDDGGFYFQVYPEDRPYEGDVPPDEGDPQIVFPKTTASTASAVAALAKMASSPAFRAADPALAFRYEAQAHKGWKFLENAWAEHGIIGAWQHLGIPGMANQDKDEIAWAATEMFILTGRDEIHRQLVEGFTPGAEDNVMWGWRRKNDAFGAAIDAYALAAANGRIVEANINQGHYNACLREIDSWAQALASWTATSAYGVSFPEPSKNFRTAGWFMAGAEGFDIAVSAVLNDAKNEEALVQSIISNFDYELGVNPVNQMYLTGLGYKRQYEIVHQWAFNDDAQLPMSGIPLGALQQGFQWIDTYESELGDLTYPLDGDETDAYAFYDRWSDAFNVATEFVNMQQAQGLAAAAYLMGKTQSVVQPYKTREVKITGLPGQVVENQTLSLSLRPGDLEGSPVIIWESFGGEPQLGPVYHFTPKKSGLIWVAVEVQWPDGRRGFDKIHFPIASANAAEPRVADQFTSLHIDCDTPGRIANAMLRDPQGELTIEGTPDVTRDNIAWMKNPVGRAIRFNTFDDQLIYQWKDTESAAAENEEKTASLELSAWLYFEKFPHGKKQEDIFYFGKNDDERVASFHVEIWSDIKHMRFVVQQEAVGKPEQTTEWMPINQWHFVEIRLIGDDYQLAVNGKTVASGKQQAANVTRDALDSGSRYFKIGQFKGYADDIMVRERF